MITANRPRLENPRLENPWLENPRLEKRGGRQVRPIRQKGLNRFNFDIGLAFRSY
jgi:hypothetical protein